MYKNSILFILGTMIVAGTLFAGEGNLILKTRTCRIAISPEGKLTEFSALPTGTNYLNTTQTSYLAQVQEYNGKKKIPVTNLTWEEKANGQISAVLSFRDKIKVEVEIVQKDDYVTFEVKKINGGKLHYFYWGPYYTSIKENIGQIGGIVYDKDFAISLRPLALNVMGGDKEFLAVSISPGAALANPVKGSGSSLGAYTKNRTQPELVTVGKYKLTTAQALPEYGITGSKIALMGMPSQDIMQDIEKLVKAENLPYPKYKGGWAKTAYDASRPKMIVPYGIDNVDKCIEIAKAGSFLFVYHKKAFETNGHYKPRPDCFPEGIKSLKECADKIRAAGLIPGVHNMTTFIDCKDKYIAPVPDKRLASCGKTAIAEEIDARTRDILLDASAPKSVYVPVAEPKPQPAKGGKSKHKKKTKEMAKLIKIDDEIIRYRIAVKKKNQIVLRDCARGYWGTKAAPHQQGAELVTLLTHKRSVLFGDYDLTLEVADNLGKAIGEAGLGITSSDGLEGALSTGHGFAMDAFTLKVFSHAKDNTLFYESSRPTSYFWYINTQQSWGEPHAAGFRHAKDYYNARVLGRIRKLLIPSFVKYRLGQYSFHKLSRITDIEWLMTKCAGLGGGFDLYITPEEYEQSGDFGKKVMATISLWEEARRKGIFSPEQREDMAKFETVYRLAKNGDGTFNVRKLTAEEAKEVIDPVIGKGPVKRMPKISKTASIDSSYLPAELKGKIKIMPDMLHHIDHIEPGGNSNTIWNFTNPSGVQPFRCIIRIRKGARGKISKPAFVINEVNNLTVNLTLKPSQYIICPGNGKASLCDTASKKVLKTVDVENINILGGSKKTRNRISFNHYRGVGGEELGPDIIVNVLLKK